jgi:hypothetical protein
LPGLTCLLGIILVNSGGRVDGAEWKAGFASRDITPQVPVYLAGYASRNRPFDEILQRLSVKALALEDAAGHRAVLVTSDLIGYRGAVAAPICQQIMERTGLARAEILLNSSHTHTGPLTLLDAEDRPDSMTPEQAEAQIAYTHRLIELTAAAAVDAVGQLEEARLRYGIGYAGFVMNRREWTPQGIKLGHNFSGYADRSVPVLRVESLDGALRGVVFGAAAHNTTLTGEHYGVSGDYAGFAQAEIERLCPGAMAMFVLGCAGSANPYPRGTVDAAQAHGEALGQEVVRLLETTLPEVRGPLTTILDPVTLPLQPAPSREELDRMLSGGGQGWQPWVARQIVSLLEQGTSPPESYECPIAAWQFGQDLTLVALPGEVVGEYVPLIQNAVGPGNLWVAAYSNDVFGYVPTAQVLRDGGYETRGMISGAIGFFAPEVEATLVEKVGSLTRKAGRPASVGASR